MMWTIPPHPETASLSMALTKAWEITSKRSSGSRSGCQRTSHIPQSWSELVPPTTKSSGQLIQPIRSIQQTYGSNVFGSKPATTGSTKYGPNLSQLRTNNLYKYISTVRKLLKLKLDSLMFLFFQVTWLQPLDQLFSV